ncbi:uncharacterized protein LOC124416100 [Diprion similis]|uniref:uncharacterized protein LOC124416100 n=1 Tax=Diprion similis TaxID=362088 RepID=UPI001EF98B85|nr:uncharacterized protein LOC124416100 [Diprion similis]
MMRERRYRTCLHLLSLIAASIILMSHDAQGAQRSVVRDGGDPAKSNCNGLDKRSSRVVGREKGLTVSLEKNIPRKTATDPQKAGTKVDTDDSDSLSGEGSGMQSTVHRNGPHRIDQRNFGGWSLLDLEKIPEQLISKLGDIVSKVSDAKLPSLKSDDSSKSLLSVFNSFIEKLEPAYRTLLKPFIEPLSTFINPIVNREDLAEFFDIILDYVGPGNERHTNLTEELGNILKPVAEPLKKLVDFLGAPLPAATEKQPSSVSPIFETTPELLDIQLSDVESFIKWLSQPDPHHKPHDETAAPSPVNSGDWLLNEMPKKNGTITTVKILVNPSVNDLKVNKTDAENGDGDQSKPHDSVSLTQGENRDDFQASDDNHNEGLLDPANYSRLTFSIITFLKKLNNRTRPVQDYPDSMKIFYRPDDNSALIHKHHGHPSSDTYRRQSIVQDDLLSQPGMHHPHPGYLPSDSTKPGSPRSTADLPSPYHRANSYSPTYGRSRHSAKQLDHSSNIP